MLFDIFPKNNKYMKYIKKYVDSFRNDILMFL